MGEELLQRLEQSVKAVQQKYGFHSGLAIEEDYCVSTMCRNLESVLLHNAKFRRAGFLKDTDDDVLVWDLVSRFLAKSEIVRFENEANLKSGIGRLRSWIRSALNDGLIEKRLQQIADSDISLLRLYYEEGSVMLDKEVRASLPGIMSEVSTVLFSFDLDRQSFNTPIRVDRTVSAKIVPSTIQKPPPIAGSSSSSKGKRKVKRAEILDDDIPEIVEPTEGEDLTPNIEGLLGGPSLFGGEDVDLENLLVGLIPQPATSASGSSDEEVKTIDNTYSLPSNEMPNDPPVQVPVLGEELDLSFEVGTLPSYGGALENLIPEEQAEAVTESVYETGFSSLESDVKSSETVSLSEQPDQPEAPALPVTTDSTSPDNTLQLEQTSNSSATILPHTPPLYSTPPLSSTPPVSSTLQQNLPAELSQQPALPTEHSPVTSSIQSENNSPVTQHHVEIDGGVGIEEKDDKETNKSKSEEDLVEETEVVEDEGGVDVVEDRNKEEELDGDVVQSTQTGVDDIVIVETIDEELFIDPYDSEDLPRSSDVISKPYPPAVKRVLTNKTDRSEESTQPVDEDANVESEKRNTLTRNSGSVAVTVSETVNTESSPPELQIQNTEPTPSTSGEVPGTTSEVLLPVRTQPNHGILSCSVPTRVPLVAQRRAMSVQLPERPLTIGSPVRTQFDVDELSNNSDAVSICSDISSVREYAASYRSTGDGMDNESGSISTMDSVGIAYSAGELRKVLSTLLQQKQDIEMQNKQLQETLTREMVTRVALKEEIEHMQNTFIQRQSHDQAVIRGLQRENQMLKQQLKKYVTVVQQLRRDDRIPSDHDLSSVLVEVPVIQPLQIPAAQSNVPFNNSAVEQKLAQVSEMHGELMELNQQLVTKNLMREKQLHEMEKKLAEIEEKEANRKQRKSDPKRTKAEKPDIDFSDFQLVDSPLLQIYIPAAMIKGEGVKKHHVYQIIVQVGGDQWTVYRRYAEFRSFHKMLVGRLPYFSKLELPGKTHFNRKVPSVVEDRRGKLEVYLQRVTSCLADRKQGVDTTHMDLQQSPSKASVTSAIHFLREQEVEEDIYRGF